MAKILLFGSSSITGVPQEQLNWIYAYTQQGHEFIVGDKKGADVAFHKALSSCGAISKSTIYSMGAPRNNLYEIKSCIFDTFYDADAKQVTIAKRGNTQGEIDESFTPFIIDDVAQEIDIPGNRQYYEFLDRKMIDDCDMAICLWDGEGKGIMHCIQLLNIKNKPCYTIKF